MDYISSQEMIARLHGLRWSYQRIGRFTKLPASTICRIVKGANPQERTEKKILRGYRKIFRDQK